MRNTPATPKRNKWVSSALSAALRNPEHGLSQELREIIADRLDNQVVEVNNLHNQTGRYLDTLLVRDYRIKLAIGHIEAKRVQWALAVLKENVPDATLLLREAAGEE